MATVLKEVDAVCIGVGFTGSILARELTKAGLRVVGLERGANRSAREDFTLPAVRDDLKYAVRQERLAAIGFDAFSSTPEELDAFVREDLAKWTRWVKDAGIEPE